MIKIWNPPLVLNSQLWFQIIHICTKIRYYMSINYCKKNNTFLLPKPTGKKSGTFTHRIYNEWNQAVCKSQTCPCCLWTNSFCVFFFGQSFQGRAAHECNTGVCKSFVFLETVNHMSLWQAVGSIPPTGGSNKSSCSWESLFLDNSVTEVLWISPRKEQHAWYTTNPVLASWPA